MLRFQCLVLDHDDTVVRSTPTVNYPSVRRVMKKLRPELEFSLEDFSLWNFEPGFQALLEDIWKLTPEEQEIMYSSWLADVMQEMPPLYEGFDRLLARHRAEGGKISVVSHSCRDNILRDYREQLGFEPDLIFGWELAEDQRKPHPYPLEETMRRLSLPPDQLLMVDDLRPGCDMAKKCGIPFAGAGWSHDTPEIEEYLRAHGDWYFKTVGELETFLFG